MTINQTNNSMTIADHAAIVLQQIDAAIALAEKAQITEIETMMKHVSINIGDWLDVRTPEIAAFIAACAGAAESGWRNTADEIEALLPILQGGFDAMLSNYAISRAASIIAAWGTHNTAYNPP